MITLTGTLIGKTAAAAADLGADHLPDHIDRTPSFCLVAGHRAY